MKEIQKFLKEIKVYDCNLTKVRVGNESDGGYVALKELCEKTNIVYTDLVRLFTNNDVNINNPMTNKNNPILDKSEVEILVSVPLVVEFVAVEVVSE